LDLNRAAIVPQKEAGTAITGIAAPNNLRSDVNHARCREPLFGAIISVLSIIDALMVYSGIWNI
jgi:hypothetical protein